MTITKSGELASFYTVNKAPIKHLRVYFSPKQAGEGDPSPENVREIEGWTSCNTYFAGKDIFDLKTELLTPTAGYTTFYELNKISQPFLLVGNLVGKNNSFRIYYYDINKTYLGRSNEIIQNEEIMHRIINPKSETKFIRIQYNSDYVDFSSIHIYLENFNDKIIDWTNDIGTIYGGYVDLVTGELVEEWSGSKTLDGSDDTSSSNRVKILMQNPDIDVFGAGRTFSKKVDDALSTVYCDSLPIMTELISNNFPYLYLDDNGTSISYTVIIGKLSEHSELTTNSAKLQFVSDWLKEHNVTIYWKSTPITHQLTPIQLQTLIGRNNIWSNADRVEVEYDLAESNDELYRRRNILLKSAPHIVTPTAVNLQSFNTDIVAPLKEFKAHFSPKQDLHGYDGPWLAGNGKNTFPYPFIDTTKTVDGIKFTDLGDGRITVSGTSTAESGYTYFELRDDIPFGTDYKNFSYVGKTYTVDGKTMDMNGLVSGIGAEYSGTSEGIGRIHLRVTAGATVNTTIAPMIYSSENPLSVFEPYENVCPITGLTGIGIGITGKNLIPADYEVAAGSWKPTNGVISGSVYKMGQFLVPKGTLYWGAATTGTAYTGLMDGPIKGGEKTYKVVTTSNRVGYTFDNSDGHKYMLTTCTYDQHIARKTYVFVTGQTGTGYVPPSGKNYEIDWTSIGEILGGYVDPVKGALLSTWIKLNLDQLDWSRDTGGAQAFFKANISAEENGAETVMCSCYTSALNYRGLGYWRSSNIPNLSIGFLNPQILAIKDDNYTDAINFKNSLANQIVVFQLKIPIEYSIDPMTLKTLRGLNNIWSSANEEIELSYWTH